MKVFYAILLTSLAFLNQSYADTGFRQTFVSYSLNGGGATTRAGGFNNDNLPTFNNSIIGVASTSLFLNGGEIGTFKNNSNIIPNSGTDVTGAKLNYRVYLQSSTPGSFTELNLPFGQDFGNGEQRWRLTNANINLANNLTPGVYVLEVYWYITTNNQSQFDGNGGANYKATFSITSTTLPVTLASFNAKAAGRMANLDWATASEANNAYFDVERSADARSFTSLGRGTTAARQTYSFTDEVPANGANYYRLKQVDTDGTFSYSPVRVVLIRNNGELTILGNPVSTELNVSGLVAGSTSELVDMNGQVRHRQTIADDQMQVNVRSFASGTYLLRVTEPTGTLTKRVLISQ